MQDDVRRQLAESAALVQAAAALAPGIAEAAALLTAALRQGGMVAFCGNGGSAADCQHLAGELVGRFRRERPAWRALALTTDTSILTAIGNDYGYEQVFARQVEAHMRRGDVLVAFSTSGNARNCVLGAEAARAQGVKTVALTGGDGGALRPVVDLCLCVASEDTPRVQEVHIAIGHIICDLVERALTV
jgi:D-sedoheptulose 7-phosphate isomerase